MKAMKKHLFAALFWTPVILPFSAGAAVVDDMILLQGGSVSIGSPDSERQRGDDERLHQVTLNAFYVSPFEVSQSLYQSVMGANPSYYRGENKPVDSVTWYDAIEFCNKLSQKEGLKPVYQVEGNKVSWDRSADGYRLLTEAEWEYAARAATTTEFNVGHQITSDDVNFEGSYPYLIEENYVNHHNDDVVTSAYRDETVDVDALPPNGFKLYNMHGNVSEWVFDYYGEYADNAVNPAGPLYGYLRVNRGGSYNDFAKHLRSAYRSATNPNDPDENLGFRIAKNSEPINDVITTEYSLNITIPSDPKVLIAYYSYTGNTENAAEILHEITGADLIRIEMQNPYRGNIYEVSQRDLNNRVLPPLTTRVEDMASYDVILLGFPTWWATLPPPVMTFLTQYDFAGKTIVPFNSNGGTKFGDSVSDLAKMTPGSYVAYGTQFFYSGGGELEDNLRQWIVDNGLGMILRN